MCIFSSANQAFSKIWIHCRNHPQCNRSLQHPFQDGPHNLAGLSRYHSHCFHKHKHNLPIFQLLQPLGSTPFVLAKVSNLVSEQVGELAFSFAFLGQEMLQPSEELEVLEQTRACPT